MSDITYILANRSCDGKVKCTYKIIGPSKEQAIEEMIDNARYLFSDDDVCNKIRAEEEYFKSTWERRGHYEWFYILEMVDGAFVDNKS